MSIIPMPPPKQNPSEYSYSAVCAFEDRTRRCVIVAPSMEDLRAAWERITLGDLPLDESRVQRVEIHPQRKRP